MLLHEALAAAVRRFPDKSAVCFPRESLTFSELWERSVSLASALERLGVRRGDRVAVLAEHSAEAVMTFWATLRAGAAVVHLNDQLSPEMLVQLLDDCEPTVVLVTRRLARERLAKLPSPRWHGRSLVFGESPALERVPSADGSVLATGSGDDRDLAAIIYTSGSTGRPKGVCLSHRNLYTVARSVIEHMPITPDDSYLMVVPLHYVHGVMQLLVHSLCGATIHFAGDFHFPNLVLERLRETRVSGFSGVPFHLTALMDRSSFLSTDLPHLRWITVTGGKMPPDQIARIRTARPGLAFHIAYGQTECAPRATALHPTKIDRKPHSVGSPIPGVRVLLLDENHHEVAPGEVGEVVVCGENVMLGYWRQPEATAAVLDAQGRLHTGDLGRFDEEGDLFILGRRDNMLKSAGERIFAEELEALLLESDEVAEAVVIGMPDLLLGQRIEAHIRPFHAPDSECESRAVIERIRRHCLGRVPFARAPRAYHLWTEFPHKPNGKIDRQKLAEHSDPVSASPLR